MTEQKKNVNVSLKLFSSTGYRAAFPHLFDPWSQDTDEADLTKKKYQIMVCLHKKEDINAIKQVKKAVKQVVTEFWGKDSIKKIGVSIDSPLVNGAKKDKYEVLENYFTISAKLSGYDKKGNLRKPPKMMAVVDGKRYTPEHKDWTEEMMMTGRYCYVISLYTSTGTNKQGNKVCASLESIMALPPLEGDEDVVMPGFGAIQTNVEDDFADILDDMGIEAADDFELDDDDEDLDLDDDDDEDLDLDDDDEDSDDEDSDDEDSDDEDSDDEDSDDDDDDEDLDLDDDDEDSEDEDSEDDEDLEDDEDSEEEPEPKPAAKKRGRSKKADTETKPAAKKRGRSKKADTETKPADKKKTSSKTKKESTARSSTRQRTRRARKKED